MDESGSTRRWFLRAGGVTGIVGLAGCSSLIGDGEQDIRDTDGDGVIDSEDYAPRDPSVQRAEQVERAGTTQTATETDTPTATETDTPTATETDTPTATETDTPTATESAGGTGAIDGFENGRMSQYFGMRGGFRVQRSVASNGNYSLQGQVQRGDNQNLFREVNFSRPDAVQAYVRVGHGAGNENAHVKYRHQSTSGNGPLHINFLMNHGSSGYGDTSGDPLLRVNGEPITEEIHYGTWYLVELRDIDWRTEVVGEVFVDGSREGRRIGFQESASSVDVLELKVNDWGNEPAWFDDISVGSP